MTYPPQPPGGGWPEQPAPGQPPQQPPYNGAAPDQYGAQPAGYETPPTGNGQPGFAQYSLDNGGTGWQQPQQYEQPQQYGQAPQYGQFEQQYQQGFGQPSAPPMSGQPYQPDAYPPPAKKRVLPFVLGGVTLVVLIAVVIGVVIYGSHKKEQVAGPASSGKASASASASPTPTRSAVPGNGVQGGKIVDAATGWGFTQAHDPWENAIGVAADKDLENPVGQSYEVRSGSYAVMQIGQLSEKYGYSGPDDLKDVKSKLTTAILKNYYGSQAKVDASKKHLDEALTQYGHKSWLWAFYVDYADSDGKATTDYMIVAVIDAHSEKAAAFWGSAPASRSSLLTQMKDSVGTLTPDP